MTTYKNVRPYRKGKPTDAVFPTPSRPPLRVLLIRNSLNDVDSKRAKVVWVAIGIDSYHAAQGKTRYDAIHNFTHVIVSQFAIDVEHGTRPFANIMQAPKEYHAAYRKAKRTGGTRTIKVERRVLWDGRKDAPTNPTLGYTLEVATAIRRGT